MRDVTELMHQYRECARNLWNTQFSQEADIGLALDAFGYIDEALFAWIVVRAISVKEYSESEDDPVLTVVPARRSVIMVNRDAGPNGGYWDAEPNLLVEDGEIVLQFLEYFDFARIPVADFRYIRCRVLSFPRRLEFQGREALLLSENVRFLYDEGSRL